MLFREHPRSTSRAMAEDAKLLHMPKEGGAGKTIVVVGGGISGLSTAKYLLQAGYKIELIEEIGPRPLVEELKKWEKMDCYVILHSDFSSIGKMPWVHQTYTNKKTGKYYITNTIKPIMSDIKVDKVITFVYNTENYEDFVTNNIDSSKIVKIYEPKLPIFSLENSINRNDVWREIDKNCTDIYWTQACRSGLQYHNNGIVSAKRVVRSLHGIGW